MPCHAVCLIVQCRLQRRFVPALSQLCLDCAEIAHVFLRNLCGVVREDVEINRISKPICVYHLLILIAQLFQERNQMPLLSQSQTSSHRIGPFVPENALHCTCSNYGWCGGWIELPIAFPTSQFLGKRQWDEYQPWDPESSCYLKRRLSLEAV